MTPGDDTGYLVIGGGLHGLATAYHLARLGAGPVTLLERFEIGHDRGSSHGSSRIFRSSYSNPVYVHLLRAASREDWPRLEKDTGKTLLFPGEGCFLGPDGGLFAEFSETMASFQDEVEILSPLDAARRFPQFSFEGMGGAINDRTAAVIAAEETIRGLARCCTALGVTFVENTVVTGIDVTSDPIRVATERGMHSAEHVVVTAGPWSAEILPFLKPSLTVARQHVGFYRLEGNPGSFAPGTFPVWGYLGSSSKDFYYGLPVFNREGVVKAARHLVSGNSDDPNAEGPPSEEALADLDAFVGRLFTARVETRVAAETCLYTNTENEDFIIDFHPENPRVVFGSGFSGHGFKFGPLTGRILAELSMKGHCDLPEWKDYRDTFALPQQTQEP